ncbi:hypothetical protein CAMRE0001_3010 [Campylobacter rectus RM3267]|uniref:Uncharacterized protein n=1 Tax=Campylobacter rectus RM3267 TaxID=553218 RepID=B9D541_CAMRE|nr:hypothetical protein CAMRE0001_3010 [Campylobacter rectus RM3267]
MSSKRGKFKAKFSALTASNLTRFINKFYPILPFLTIKRLNFYHRKR